MKDSGECRIRTYEGDSQQIYSLPRLTAPETPLKSLPTLSHAICPCQYNPTRSDLYQVLSKNEMPDL